METARNVAGSVANAANQATETVKDWASSAGQNFNQAAETVRDSASAAYDRTSEMAEQAGEELTQFVRRNPIASVLIGLGIGFLIGRTLRNVV